MATVTNNNSIKLNGYSHFFRMMCNMNAVSNESGREHSDSATQKLSASIFHNNSLEQRCILTCNCKCNQIYNLY